MKSISRKRCVPGKCGSASRRRTMGMSCISLVLHPISRMLLFGAHSFHQMKSPCFIVCLCAFPRLHVTQTSSWLPRANSISSSPCFGYFLRFLSMPFCLMFLQLCPMLSKVIAMVHCTLQSSIVDSKKTSQEDHFTLAQGRK